MRFSKRLEAVKNLLSPASLIIDVGTDHAYLPIKAVSEGIAGKAIAIDNKKGPLSIAKDNIRKASLSDAIFPLLSEGLKNVEIVSDGVFRIDDGKALIPDALDFSIVIAGMGGENIMGIMSESPDICKAAKEIILEPQKNIDRVPLFLQENSYEILSEKNVFSDGKYYTIYKAKTV